jgi:hypothetical protein
LIGTQGEWFEYWMRDVPTGVMDKPSVAYYVMGDTGDPHAPGNEWRSADFWPPPAAAVAFHLRSEGRLTRQPPTDGEDPESFAYDPRNPVPTLGGGNLILPAGPYDQRPVLDRPDVLVYQTEILSEPVETAGPVAVVLHASSDRLDTDYTAKLCDVYPDGRAMLICDGILRARHRNSMEIEELMVPGTIYELTIDLWDTAIIFGTGHRILLAVSSSNHPRFDTNPNTGDPFMQHDTTLVATNTIYHSPAHPSHLLLRITGTAAHVGRAEGGRDTCSGSCRLSVSPNPFTDAGTIRLELARAARVDLGVYDVAGRLVRRLHSGFWRAGEAAVLQWDGCDARGKRMAAGPYYLRLSAKDGAIQRRLLFIPG